jgi:hypothetical protein
LAILSSVGIFQAFDMTLHRSKSYVSVLSNVNLIFNIGFGNGGTNTKEVVSIFSNIPTQTIEFPLNHPPFMIKDTNADQFTGRSLYSPCLSIRVKRTIKKICMYLSKCCYNP